MNKHKQEVYAVCFGCGNKYKYHNIYMLNDNLRKHGGKNLCRKCISKVKWKRKYIDDFGVHGMWQILDHRKLNNRATEVFVKCINCGYQSWRVRKKIVYRPKTCNKCRNKSRGEIGCDALYIAYIKQARKRGFIFSLTKDTFKKLTTDSCYYCHKSPSNTHKTHSEKIRL